MRLNCTLYTNKLSKKEHCDFTRKTSETSKTLLWLVATETASDSCQIHTVLCWSFDIFILFFLRNILIFSRSLRRRRRLALIVDRIFKFNKSTGMCRHVWHVHLGKQDWKSFQSNRLHRLDGQFENIGPKKLNIY